MKLYLLRAELAVMNILGEHRICAGDAMSLTTLTTSWRRYGLRERDLSRAISRLQVLGLIEHKRHGSQRKVMLTPSGMTWLRSFRGVAARLLLLPRYLHTQLSQFLWPSEPLHDLARRDSDRPRRET